MQGAASGQALHLNHISMQTLPVILLADNDALSLLILQKYFSIYHCKATWVHCLSAAKTLAYLERHGPPELFIIDPVMPDMDPKAFLDALQSRQVFYTTAACILSALTQDDVVALTVPYGVFGRYAKPITKQITGEMIKHSAICNPATISYSG